MGRTNDSFTAGSRQPDPVRASALARLARLDPFALIGASWWLALVAIGVLQQAHIGLHEHNELPPLLHLLRDAALAVPSAAVALATASVVLGPGRHEVAPGARNGMTDFGRFRWVLLAALLFAILSVPGNQLHGALFGAEEEAGVPWFADATFDAAVAFIGALIALFPVAIVVGPPIRRLDAGSTNVMARSTT
jgi:hypothetical protein